MGKLDYEAIKATAKEAGCRVTDLLVLAPQNDPFYVGTPASVDAAHWFAGLWQDAGFTTGVHLRRIHYRLISIEGLTLPNGMPYENTERCWQALCAAGKYARELGLVDPLAFEDRRNPDAHIYANYERHDREPGWRIYDPFSDLDLPSIEADLAGSLDLTMPSPMVDGYEYRAADDQPYHLELWIEKSTMDDVLLPLGQRYQVNIVTSLGYQSITSVLDMIRRIAEGGKPARIFYISDFDPAGDGMPVAVARQLEFWLGQYAPGADIALLPLALTRDQVRSFRLPRTPVKDSDLRKGAFEDRNGEGAVELDALEALYPGELAKLVETAIAPYRDMGLARKLARAEAEAQSHLDDAWDAATSDIADGLDALQNEAAAILGTYQGELKRLGDALDGELAPLRGRLDDIRHAITTRADALEVYLPERPEPEPMLVDESAWLYSSERSYLEQLDVYKAHQGKG